MTDFFFHITFFVTILNIVDTDTKTKQAHITFSGAVSEVTGSNFLFEARGKKILIDCGLFQGRKVCDDRNREPFPYDPKTIDALFVTHAHIDHVGRIPKLVRDGFTGVIYSTPPTKEIAELMLIDSMGVLEKEARQDNHEPLYTERDVAHAMKLWKTVPYQEKISLITSGELTAMLHDSGHILGSSMIEIASPDHRILFTGDLGNSPAPLLADTEIVPGIDYLVMESVYGDRNHEPPEERLRKTRETIVETVRKEGIVLIPAFSLERTQNLLFEINNLVETKKIPPVTLYLDSPLAINVTKVYKKFSSYFKTTVQSQIKSGDDIFRFPGLRMTLTTDESKSIRTQPNPKIIMAGSGMSNGGRIIHHEKAYLPLPTTTLFLVGYQAAGTLGRVLQEGAKAVTILGERIPVRARVVQVSGYSSHKDSDHLLGFVEAMGESLKKVFVVIGEPKSSFFLTQRIRDYLGLDALSPEQGSRVTIPF